MKLGAKPLAMLLIVLALTALAVSHMRPRLAQAMPPTSSDFTELLEALRRGDIAQGKPIPRGVGIARPFFQFERLDERDRSFALLVFAFERSLLSLYILDTNVFAAQHIEGAPEFKERWFFCDHDLFKAYVELAIRVPDPMEEFKKNNPGVIHDVPPKKEP